MKAVSGLGAAAAAVSAVGGGNGPRITEEDLAKLVDALEANLDGRRPHSDEEDKCPNGSLSESEDESSDEDDDDKLGMLSADDIAKVGIKVLITL